MSNEYDPSTIVGRRNIEAIEKANKAIRDQAISNIVAEANEVMAKENTKIQAEYFVKLAELDAINREKAGLISEGEMAYVFMKVAPIRDILAGVPPEDYETMNRCGGASCDHTTKKDRKLD